MRLVHGTLAALFIAAGCGGQGSGFVVGQGPSGPCDLSLDKLDGTTWVMAEAMPDRTTVENPQARVRFYQESGQQKADYTVKSLGDVYTYDCAPFGDEEWLCQEPPRLQAWCMALEADKEGSCTPAKLRELGATESSDDDIKKAIGEAVATANKYRGGDSWQQFKFANNNLGNKLRGMLYARPRQKTCNIVVNDMYMTIYDGQKREDSNPVGTNPFVKSDAEYLWEHCADSRTLADLTAPERIPPDQIPAQRLHSKGQAIHYLYYGESAVQPADGCSYSYDAFAQWRPVQRDVKVEPGPDGKLDWRASHAFTDDAGLQLTDPNNPIGVFTMVRYKACGGEREKIDVVCNAAVVN